MYNKLVFNGSWHKFAFNIMYICILKIIIQMVKDKEWKRFKDIMGQNILLLRLFAIVYYKLFFISLLKLSHEFLDSNDSNVF